MGEMLPRAQLIGPGVRSALGGPMEEVSIQEALARGEGSSLLMWEAGASDMNVLDAKERLPVGGKRSLCSQDQMAMYVQ